MKKDKGKCGGNLVCIHGALASHAPFQVLHVFGEEARLGDKAQRRGKCNQLLCSKLETLPYSFPILQFILTLDILPCASQLIKIKQKFSFKKCHGGCILNWD